MPVSVATSQPTPPALSSAPLDLRALWSELLEAVGCVSRFTRGYLLEAHPVSFEKRVFTIGFAAEFADHLGLVDNSKNHALLQTKLSELGHPGSQVRFVRAEPPEEYRPAAAAQATVTAAPASTAGPLPKPPATGRPGNQPPLSKVDFKNDPLIQKALEIFKGQITEVRA